MAMPETGIAASPYKEDRGGAWLASLVLCLLCIVFWMLLHGYRGIFHDAALYTLQALGKLSPESLSKDVFLHLGSQDRFTIFSPLFAAATRLLGPESAAALLTFLSQGALVLGAWLLARTVTSSRGALLGVAAFIGVPGYYGMGRIFACIEPFLTPRMGAEALALASLAAALRGRTTAALLLIVAASLIHPIMASAGAAALVFLWILDRPRSGRWLVFAAGLAGAGAALLVSRAAGFDPVWLQLIADRSPYLFIGRWELGDWVRVAVTLTTLWLGVRALPDERARRLCQAVLCTVVTGLALSWVACDELHRVLFTQLQTWRWLWLGTLCAALLLPAIAASGFASARAGGVTTILLLAAWIFGSDAVALCLAGAALAAPRWVPKLKPGEARWILWGALAVMGLAIIYRFATNLEFTDEHYLDWHIPLWQRRTMSFVQDGSLPLGLVALTAWLKESSSRGGLATLVVLGCVTVAALLPQSSAQWSARDYPPQRVAEFAGWRAQIMPGAEVFWPDSPYSAWLLLDRPSYLSSAQTSGMVFSRAAALELQRRASALAPLVPMGAFLSWEGAAPGLGLSVAQLQGVCRQADFEFLVTRAELGFEPLAIASTANKTPPWRLYRCPASSAGAAG